MPDIQPMYCLFALNSELTGLLEKGFGFVYVEPLYPNTSLSAVIEGDLSCKVGTTLSFE